MTHIGIGKTAIAAATLASAVVLGAQAPAAQGAGSEQDHVAALEQTLQQGLARIRQYEWIETTVTSLDGEEKSRTQNRCYYGADGTVQKVAIGGVTPEESEGRGRRRGRLSQRVVENKKDDIQEYMQRAGALIHRYVPPNPERIHAAKDAGRVTMSPQPGGLVQLVISQYLQAGDSMTMDLNPATNLLTGLGVNAYLDTPEDVVTLAVTMSALADGAFYAAETTLDAPAKDIRVVIQNSGHKPVSR